MVGPGGSRLEPGVELAGGRGQRSGASGPGWTRSGRAGRPAAGPDHRRRWCGRLALGGSRPGAGAVDATVRGLFASRLPWRASDDARARAARPDPLRNAGARPRGGGGTAGAPEGSAGGEPPAAAGGGGSAGARASQARPRDAPARRRPGRRASTRRSTSECGRAAGSYRSGPAPRRGRARQAGNSPPLLSSAARRRRRRRLHESALRPRPPAGLRRSQRAPPGDPGATSSRRSARAARSSPTTTGACASCRTRSPTARRASTTCSSSPARQS